MTNLTHEQVNKFEELLREAEAKIEEAGRMICNVQGCGDIWNMCNDAAEAVAKPIHQSYRLRPRSKE